jgi:hypothetical protein
MVQEEAVAKPKPSTYIETEYTDKVTFEIPDWRLHGLS